ncbi:DUF507 family protein [Bradymonadaceae bacterium TMQ3]|uniref:DUF507 family protein n=2 Tax=Lujinxingia sediminis TaxID=2480984 RepID=A0ABY0CMQ4_9DELT|nr:DUF507 family protein [Bradymonadaceae bacterium TMQ3]RVU40695.1 DUF507 family protein [Lujinxingia sediminis]TXC67613.1 DUF507 family protein [Bradymonadales bacterium TMQ1]
MPGAFGPSGGVMRLYGGQVPVIAEEIIRTLTRAGDLEIASENLPEVELDIQSVLREYIRLDRELTERAKDIAMKYGDSSVGREKRKLAKAKGIELSDDPLGYIISQIIETFFHSNFVDEVYSTDNDLRRKINPILKRHTNVQEELDQEVRGKIKNLEEGSAAWEIEYEKVMGNLKRLKNLE